VSSGRNGGNPLIDFIGRATEGGMKEVRAVPTHVGLTLIGTILFALSVIFRVWG